MNDPIDAAFKALHQGNLLEAEKAKVQNLSYAGNETARVLGDILESGQITCQISRAVVIATLERWKAAKNVFQS
jgi:hypothetical protein